MIRPRKLMKKRVYSRGKGTVELPFLMSCVLFLLDRRFWILGIRSPLGKVRFDVVAKYAWTADHAVLVEAKYRGDGRPVRPYEIKRFHEELEAARKSIGSNVYGMFMTNSFFSREALELARKRQIRTIPNVPLIFRLMGEDERKGGRG